MAEAIEVKEGADETEDVGNAFLGIMWLAIIGIVLSGPAFLVHHIWVWLNTGAWPGTTISEGLTYLEWGHPHTSMVGLQTIFDNIMLLQLWYAIPLTLLALAGLWAWAGDLIRAWR